MHLDTPNLECDKLMDTVQQEAQNELNFHMEGGSDRTDAVLTLRIRAHQRKAEKRIHIQTRYTSIHNSLLQFCSTEHRHSPLLTHTEDHRVSVHRLWLEMEDRSHI